VARTLLSVRHRQKCLCHRSTCSPGAPGAQCSSALGSINGILYMRTSQVGRARVARGSQFASVANPTMECAGSNPNAVKENSLGRLAPGSVGVSVGQALKGRQNGGRVASPWSSIRGSAPFRLADKGYVPARSHARRIHAPSVPPRRTPVATLGYVTLSAARMPTQSRGHGTRRRVPAHGLPAKSLALHPAPPARAVSTLVEYLVVHW
jgi:hypothetical protein